MLCNCQKSDLLKPEPFPAFDGLLAQVFRTTIPIPCTGTRSPQPSLGRNEDAVIRVQRLVDKLLRDLRPVGVRGVDEINPKLRQALEGSNRFGSVKRWTPDAGASDTHRSKPKAVNFDVATNLEWA